MNPTMFHGLTGFAEILLSSLLATSLMTVFALSFTGVGLVSVSALEAVGSSLSGSERSARKAGIAMHLFAGIAFAFMYYLILHSLELTHSMWSLVGGAILGAAHGYIVSFVIVISIGEHSHFSQYRDAGIPLALVYLTSHVVYGSVLGLMFYLLGLY